MYDQSDPRSGLVPSRPSSGNSKIGLIADPQIGRYYESKPCLTDKTGRHWLTRGRNSLVAYTDANPGAEIRRVRQIDEYCVLLPEAGCDIEWNSESISVPGYSILFVPPGDSVISMPEGGILIRMFTTQSKDLSEACSNARAYDKPRPHIPGFIPWPVPTEGWKVRHYPLSVPKDESRFGRIFRCTSLMVNVLEPYEGPRDPSKMSPHHHDDFEQISLALNGRFKHYLRWPWTTDMNDWREDQSLDMKAPSVLVIPPPVIHTTQAIGSGSNLLVDIFSPPRSDFSEKPGWVLNSADYPMPPEALRK